MPIGAADVYDLVSRWWFNYDEANFDVLASLLTDDCHFTCRTDTGNAPWEEFARADCRGRDDVMAWQTDHRLNSPYPLRHNGTVIHIAERRSDDEVAFASYIHVTHITEAGVSPLPGGKVTGAVRRVGADVQISELNVVLDTMISEPLAAIRARETPQ